MKPAWSLTRRRTQLVVLEFGPTEVSVGIRAPVGMRAPVASRSILLSRDDARSLAAALTSWANKVSQVSTQDASAERAGGCAPAHPARSPSYMKQKWFLDDQFLKGQLDEWRKAHSRWSEEKVRLEARIAQLERIPRVSAVSAPEPQPAKRPWIAVPGAVVAEQSNPRDARAAEHSIRAGAHSIRAQQPAKCRLPVCDFAAEAGKHGFCCWAHCDEFADLKAETADQT